MARPGDIDALQDVILGANGRRATLELRGGGTRREIGAPDPADEVLDLGGFSGVIDYDPGELVITAGAGASMAEIEALLAANGQMLAFEPMDHGPLFGLPAGGGTLGGCLSANASGPRRLSAGSARDHFLGLAGVTGRGDIFKAGGRVVKNVTGYDLPKLLAGAWGTLAALTEVTVKVMPRPREAATLAWRGLDDRQACALMGLAVAAPAPVSGAAHLPPEAAAALIPGAGAATLLRLEGSPGAVAAGADLLRRLDAPPGGETIGGRESDVLWRAMRDVVAFAGDPRPLWRISVPPAQGWRVLETLAPQGASGLYDWAGGLIWLAAEEGACAGVRQAVAAIGGHATLVRAPADLRRRVPVFQPEPPALAALSSRVKASFDPLGVLGPRHRLSPAEEPRGA